MFLHKQNCYMIHKSVLPIVAMRSEKVQDDRRSDFQLCFENLLHELVFGLLSCAENAEEFNITVFMLSISIQHDASILFRLHRWVCRLLDICIKISVTANAKPAIFPSHGGSSGSRGKILSSVH